VARCQWGLGTPSYGSGGQERQQDASKGQEPGKMNALAPAPRTGRCSSMSRSTHHPTQERQLTNARGSWRVSRQACVTACRCGYQAAAHGYQAAAHGYQAAAHGRRAAAHGCRAATARVRNKAQLQEPHSPAMVGSRRHEAPRVEHQLPMPAATRRRPAAAARQLLGTWSLRHAATQASQPEGSTEAVPRLQLPAVV
jgi:hypothetical protein